MSEPANPEVEILNTALELREPERSAYLDKSCAGDAALRQRVEELVRAHEQAENFLKVPPAGLDFKRTVLVSVPLTEKPGDRIGRYKLLQQIGEGGCGVVYMAEQDEPVRRRVALKVIKLGMDTKSVIARFEAERQALALMDHPNIAKVLDAGATETGRPYFVMELVRGIKITDYCDENKVSTEDRLKLFIQVCQAIQHAHQKGIIHRDIKPSNILITVNDGVPVPKVIDFGIAKATQGRLTDKTLFTAFEQFIGTPAYMSPEQAVMTSLDIDTRSDIYSLGVLLYELLTGKTPFDANELLQSGLDAMRRTIREIEPQKPSTRLITMLDVERTTTAKHRHTDPPKLIHLVRGDLDWIVMKSLEKDRARRYETANGLTADIQRHLNDEPIVARPPSTLYRYHKAVRRNKLAFATVTAVLVLLLAGITVSTLQAHRLKVAYADIGQRILLESNLRKQAEADKTTAENEAVKSRRLVTLFKGILQSASPWNSPGRDTTLLREVLDKTAQRVNDPVVARNHPDITLELQDTIAAIYREFGEYAKAEALLRGAPERARQLWGEDDPRVADLLNNLGLAVGPAKPIEAEVLQREALSIRRKVLGTNNMQTAQVERDLAMVFWQEGKLDEAEITASEALTIERKVGGDNDAEVASTLMGLGQIYRDQTNFAKAEAADREALKINQTAWSDQVNPAVAASLEKVAFDLKAQGKFADAEPFLRKSVDLYRKIYGENESRFIAFRTELIEVLKSEGKLGEAENLLNDWLANPAADKSEIAKALWALGELCARTSRWNEAVADFSRVVELDPNKKDASLAFAVLLLKAGRYEEYRLHCHKFLEQPGGNRAAKASLLLPVDGTDFERACKQTEFAANTTEPRWVAWMQLNKALGDCRRGHFETVDDLVGRVVATPEADTPIKAQACFIQALADAHLQRKESAQAALDGGVEMIGRSCANTNDLGSGWCDWVIADLLRAEADALIKSHSVAASGDKQNPQ